MEKIIKPPHLSIVYFTFSLIFAFMVFWSSCDHQQKQMYELHVYDNQLRKSKHYYLTVTVKVEKRKNVMFMACLQNFSSD